MEEAKKELKKIIDELKKEKQETRIIVFKNGQIVILRENKKDIET